MFVSLNRYGTDSERHGNDLDSVAGGASMKGAAGPREKSWGFVLSGGASSPPYPKLGGCERSHSSPSTPVRRLLFSSQRAQAHSSTVPGPRGSPWLACGSPGRAPPVAAPADPAVRVAHPLPNGRCRAARLLPGTAAPWGRRVSRSVNECRCGPARRESSSWLALPTVRCGLDNEAVAAAPAPGVALSRPRPDMPSAATPPAPANPTGRA